MSDRSKKTKLNIEIESDTVNLLNYYCKRSGKTESEVINELLVNGLFNEVLPAGKVNA